MTPARNRAWPALAALALALLGPGCARTPSQDAQQWWVHVRALAADSMRGRGTGTSDYVVSARYVARELRRLGVRPAGDAPADADSDAAYFQSAEFVKRTIRESESELTLLRDDGPIHLRLGEDANLSVGIEAADSVEAPMTFVGYGLSVPEAGYDDLAGADLRGRIAVYVRGGPDTLPGPLRASAQTTGIRWKALRARGAVGIGSISNPSISDIPWSKSTLTRLEPNLSLAGDAFDETPGLEVSFRINPAHADTFLHGTGHSVAELLALADQGRPLPSFALPGRIRARTRFDRALVASPNVVGVIPGSDPKLKDEYVVVSAHLDHLGVGHAVNGDSIYNGAMDNASGVATLLEFARYATQPGMTLRRSILLLALTGEEEGLEGSRYFAARPTVPISSIVADLNIDMFLPLGALDRVIAYGLKESDLGEAFTEFATRFDVLAQDDPQPRRRVFTRSDQYSFILRGVPSLMFDIGFEPGTPEEGRHKKWIAERYHAPSDDLSQPLNLETAAAFNRLIFDFTREVANRDQRPQWKPNSYFRRYADSLTVATR